MKPLFVYVISAKSINREINVASKQWRRNENRNEEMAAAKWQPMKK
jgi:hypothetical protein